MRWLNGIYGADQTLERPSSGEVSEDRGGPGMLTVRGHSETGWVTEQHVQGKTEGPFLPLLPMGRPVRTGQEAAVTKPGKALARKQALLSLTWTSYNCCKDNPGCDILCLTAGELAKMVALKLLTS